VSERFRVLTRIEAAKELNWLEPYEEWGWVVVEYPENGPPRFVGEDGGEPEDQLLIRDWRWVVPALNAAFEAGKLAATVTQPKGER